MTSPTLPPGPRGVPVFGHAIGLSRGALPYLRACATTYGDLVPLRFFGKRVLLVNHPDYIGQVLAMNHRKVVKSVARRATTSRSATIASPKARISWSVNG